MTRSLASGVVLAAGIAAACATLTASAGTVYDDAGIYPGQVITNTVTGRSSLGEMPPASASFVIGEIPFSGVLRAFGLAGSAPGLSYEFTESEYSSGGRDGPFVPMGRPIDNTETGGGVSIALGQVRVRETGLIRKGEPIFFVLEASGLNYRSASADRAVISLTDSVTGDAEHIRLRETGPDTGVFTGWMNTGASRGGSDGVMETTRRSTIVGVMGSSENAPVQIAVDVSLPNGQGRVFDAVTGEPIDGVTVRLTRSGGGEAAVLGSDFVSAYPSEVVSGEDVTDASGRVYGMDRGGFLFPYVPPGRYVVTLAAPDGYNAPSRLSNAEILLARPAANLSDGSRLEAFSAGKDSGVSFDIPMDPLLDDGVVRTSTPDVAEIGDVFRYENEIRVSGMDALSVRDDLPAGVIPVKGSVRANGEKVSSTVSGRTLIVPRIPVPPTGEVRVTYSARVSPAVRAGDVLRSVTAVRDADTGLGRMVAFHDLRTVQAFDLDDAVIVGEVRSGGCSGSGPERDMSGIRVLLESGDYAITDERGRFHFSDIPHKPRVVQVDENTLPRHASLVPCSADTRSAGSARSRFVDVRPGMIGRAEFAVTFDEAAMRAEDAEAASEVAFDDVRDEERFDQAWLDSRGEVLFPELLSPDDGATPAAPVVNVLALRNASHDAEVLVNGVPADPIMREELMRSADGSAVVDKFSALRIREGRNTIGLVVRDRDGAEVFREERSVLFASAPEKAEFIGDGASLESDGRTRIVMRYRLTGVEGVPVRPGTRVQVSVEKPFMLLPNDARSSQPASEKAPRQSVTVVTGRDGEISFRLAPVTSGGILSVRIGAGDADIGHKIRVRAVNRPWVLVGLAEGTLAERHVRERMRRSGDIRNDLNGRVSLFAEGVIRGEWLMTLRLDTDRSRDDGFGGIDPEKDYVVYGDRSYQDDASPSRFPLYVRMSREGAEMLLGDFDASVETDLVSVNRRMTGVRALADNGKVRVLAFLARTTQRYVEDRIGLDGTAGPFKLSQKRVVPGSETVRVVTASPIDPGDETSSVELAAGLDYLISYVSGEITLRRPMSAFGDGLERRHLRVSYETDDEMADGVTAGVRAEVRVSDRVRIGGTALHDSDADGAGVSATVIGADIGIDMSDALSFRAEIVGTGKRDAADVTSTGVSAEVRAEYDDGDNLATIFVRREDGDHALTSDMSDRRVRTIGAEISALVSPPAASDYEEHVRQVRDRDGSYVEGSLLSERAEARGDEDERSRMRAELLYVNRDRRVERAVGLTAYGEGDRDGERKSLHFASRGNWSVGRVTFGVGAEYALRTEGDTGVRDRLSLSAGYGLTGGGSAFVTWDGARGRADGGVDGVFSAGVTTDDGDGSDMTLGVARSASPGGSGSAVFGGGNRLVRIGERTEVSIGADGQKDLGGFDAPAGVWSRNPFDPESFITARIGARYTEDLWSAGFDADRKWSDRDPSGSIRISADGDISERLSVGARGTIILGDTSEDDGSEVMASAAVRGGTDGAVTLVTAKYSDDTDDGLRLRKAYVTIGHNRFVTPRDEVSARYAVKAQRAGADGDVLHFVGAEWRHDLSPRLDVGVSGAVMRSRDGLAGGSLGLSVGVTPFRNGWVSLGYNLTGFEDDDFSEGGETGEGPFVQFRLKFDQDVIRSIFR